MAECPRCGHEVELPSVLWSRGWRELKCAYCGAELKKKNRRWYLEVAVLGIVGAAFVGKPFQSRYAYLLPILAPFLGGILDNLRPRLVLRDPSSTPANLNLGSAVPPIRPAGAGILDIFRRRSLD